MDNSAFDPFDEIVFVVNEVAVSPALIVVAPVTASVLDKVAAPVTAIVEPAVKAPVTSTASAMVTFVESLESKVVPLILNALIRTSPVPLGWIDRSAFDPFDAIVFVVKEVAVSPANIVVAPLTDNVLDSVAAPVTPNVLDSVAAPETLAVPSTINPSLMFIELESSALKVVPAILIPEATTPPVPFGNKIMSSFDLALVIL